MSEDLDADSDVESIPEDERPTWVAIPAKYLERQPRTGGRAVSYPAVSLRSGKFYFLQQGYRALGEPDALRYFIDGNRIALVPADPEHHSAYQITTADTPFVTAGWLKHELAMGEQPPDGRYPLERDAALWIIDFGAGPVDEDRDDDRGNNGANDHDEALADAVAEARAMVEDNHEEVLAAAFVSKEYDDEVLTGQILARLREDSDDE